MRHAPNFRVTHKRRIKKRVTIILKTYYKFWKNKPKINKKRKTIFYIQPNILQ